MNGLHVNSIIQFHMEGNKNEYVTNYTWFVTSSIGAISRNSRSHIMAKVSSGWGSVGSFFHQFRAGNYITLGENYCAVRRDTETHLPESGR